MKRLSIGLVLLLALVAPARAQLQGGSISGTVADEQGAILPGVTITLRGVDATQEVTTEGNGEFWFLNLAPGLYTLSASLQGFTTLVREQVQVVVGRNGFVLDDWDGFHTDYHGLEAGLIKRFSNRWMARVGFALNNSRAHYEPQALRNENGNPTPTIGVPLDNGGQFAPQSAGSGAGTIFMSANWQFNANALYQAAYGIELGANVFGRQGYPFLIYRPQSLGADAAVQVRLTPEVDTIRFANVWSTDVRVARSFNTGNVRLRVVGDMFNLFNANTPLVRNNNIGSPTLRTLAQNLSPRILRFGLIVGF